MTFLRYILGKYRELLYLLCDKDKHGVMSDMQKCNIICYTDILHYDDVVHPSIKFGRVATEDWTWWMVYTPYYSANPKYENPILCYSDDDKRISWTVCSKITDEHQIGYNSDPALFFDDNNCIVFWRECETERTSHDGCLKAVYAKCYLGNQQLQDFQIPLMKENHMWEDRLVSPAFVKRKQYYYSYAMHLRFKNDKFQFKIKLFNRISQTLLNVLALLYIYNQQKCYGIAIWKTPSLDEPFQYVKTIKIKNVSRLYVPWHLDTFEYRNSLYAVLQTNQCNADIVLAVSYDYENFEIFPRPLITTYDLNRLNKSGLYKPTAFVYEDVFNLYITSQDIKERQSNRLYKFEIPFNELLKLVSQ